LIEPAFTPYERSGGIVQPVHTAWRSRINLSCGTRLPAGLSTTGVPAASSPAKCRAQERPRRRPRYARLRSQWCAAWSVLRTLLHR